MVGFDKRLLSKKVHSYRVITIKIGRGQPQGPSGLALPLAQGVILETQDQVPHQDPCMEPATPSTCVSVCLMNK